MFKENKYTVIYFKIVKRAKIRILDEYSEIHHIIPKSLGGDNRKENLVKLTAREHFICHWLLTKMIENKHDEWKMINALGLMIWCENENQQRYKINSHLYEILKNKHSKLKSWAQIGEKNGFYKKKHTEQTRKIMSEKAKGRIPWNKGKEFIGAGMTGKTHTEETKKKISEIKKGQKVSFETCEKISKILLEKNIKRSDETKEKMRNAKLGIKHPRKTCEFCGKNITIAMYTRWHGNKCKS